MAVIDIDPSLRPSPSFTSLEKQDPGSSSQIARFRRVHFSSRAQETGKTSEDFPKDRGDFLKRHFSKGPAVDR